MQITSGLISCDPEIDPSLIEGDSSVDWTQVTIGSLLIVNGVSYGITSVNSVDRLLRISPNWVGAAVSSVNYVIVRDFTLNMQLPLLNPGDLEAAAIFSRAMRVLDGLANLVAGDPSISDYLLMQTAHGFIPGNVIRINGSAYELANSSSTVASNAIGVVSSVVDANSFYIRSVGPLTGINIAGGAGIDLVAGQMYYLRLTPTVVSGKTINICTGDSIDAGSLLVPVFQANTTSSAFILGMAQASTNVFGANKAGLVPDPGASLTGRILYDTGWGSPTGLVNNTILARHLDPTIPWVTDLAGDLDWSNFAARASDTPIHAFITDLQTRLKTAETKLSSGTYTRKVFTRRSDSSGTWNWAVPPGVQWARVTVISGECIPLGTGFYYTPPRGVPTEIVQPHGHALRFRLSLEGVTALSGTIGPFRTELFYNSSVAICAIGTVASDLTKRAFAIFETPAIPFDTRPSSSPFVYGVNFERFNTTLVSYHFPFMTTAPGAVWNLPVPYTSNPSGYCFVNDRVNPPYTVFSGAVIIETGNF